MRNPFVFLILVLLMMLSSMLLTPFPEDSEKAVSHKKETVHQVKKEPLSKLSFSEFMTRKMAPMNRLEKVNLFSKEGLPVIIPTVAYLNRLEASIPENWPGNSNIAIVQRTKCEDILIALRKDWRNITSILNPVYGRPVFTGDRLRYIRWSEQRIADLLRSLEYECIRLTFEERQSINF